LNLNPLPFLPRSKKKRRTGILFYSDKFLSPDKWYFAQDLETPKEKIYCSHTSPFLSAFDGNMCARSVPRSFRAVDKTVPALLAEVGLLPGVQPHVDDQGPLVCEPPLAEGAAVGPLPRVDLYKIF